MVKNIIWWKSKRWSKTAKRNMGPLSLAFMQQRLFFFVAHPATLKQLGGMCDIHSDEAEIQQSTI